KNAAPTSSTAPVADGGEAPTPRVTLASLPRTADVALERDAIMGVLQYGHAVDAAVLDPALALPFHHPALEAVRRAVVEQPDRTRIGWAAAAVEAVREPYRTLAAELLTADFPARTEAGALASTADLARRLRLRVIEREKSELMRHIQRVDVDSDGGRAVRIRLRELDVERARLIAE
ncbi:DNA primase, partial [Microbacterium sp. zg.Y909]|nr:DNA primase [Microbacterium sp. zg.Y909]